MYVLFPVFVFSVTIVINNLINGLAVSDTTVRNGLLSGTELISNIFAYQLQTIRAESELVGITEMVSIIRRYEKAQEALEFIHST